MKKPSCGRFDAIMPVFAILLLLMGAILHTTWNILLKNSEDKYITTWWMVFYGGIFSSVALLFTGLPSKDTWIFIFFSVLVEAVYFIALSYAYRDNEFSLIYPIARGAAPAFLAIWSVLFLHEKLTGGGLIGLSLIIVGLAVIGSGNLLKTKSDVHTSGIAIAVFIALLISIYTVIDGAAVKRASALPYVFTVFSLVPIPLAPFVLKQYGWKRLTQTWHTQGFRLILPAVLGVSAYLLALLAYRIAPISYSGAVREVSVVMGAFAGWRFFGEKMGSVRLIGSFVIFSGILMVALLG
jgi:drug/metabolite transporter (DMT)-like permease